MSQKLKVVTIGGGSSYTPELLEGFLKRYHELPVSELWLVGRRRGPGEARYYPRAVPADGGKSRRADESL